MDTTNCFIARVSDLMPGSTLASGHVVESVATGGRRYGPSVKVTFTDGKESYVGGDNRIWVKAL